MPCVPPLPSPLTPSRPRSDQIRTEAFLHLRYERTDCALMCSAKGHPPTPGSCRAGDFAAAFASRCVPAGTPGSGWGLPRPATLTPSPCHRYRTEFGFTIPDRAVVVDDVRVRGTGSTGISCESPLAPSGEPPRVETVRGAPGPALTPPTGLWVRGGPHGTGAAPAPQVTRCYFEEGYLETPVFLLEQLSCDHSIPGPAIIIDKNRQEMGAGGTPGGWRGP